MEPRSSRYVPETCAFEATLANTTQQQVAVRILQLNPTTKTLSYLTGSFYPFVNFGTNNITTFRPSVAVTTRQICVAAKGSVNSQNNPALGPDSLPQTTFYAVINHPNPADDPTPPVGGAVKIDKISIAGGKIQIEWQGTATLQSSTKMPAAATDWSDLTGATSPTSLTPPASGNIYYRLKQ